MSIRKELESIFDEPPIDEEQKQKIWDGIREVHPELPEKPQIPDNNNSSNQS